jgi:hypothetical protein
LKNYETADDYEIDRSNYFKKYNWKTIFFRDKEVFDEKYILSTLKGGD